MTYRIDPNLVRRHDKVTGKETKTYKMLTKKEVLKKQGTVAWIVSN